MRHSLKKAYQQTWQSFKKSPSLSIPFLIFAGIEFTTLIFVHLTVRLPLRSVFGPIIRTLWGEQYLHYPTNFILLPKLTSLAKIGLSVVFASLLTGMAITLVYDIYTGKKQIKLKTCFSQSLKKYLSLFTIVLLLVSAFYLSIKLITAGLSRYFVSGHTKLLFLEAKVWIGPLIAIINFVVALIIQSAFIYAIPILIYDKEKLLKSILGSFATFKKLFIPTIILVGLPMLAYIPVIILNYNTSFLMYKFSPEIILLVSSLSIIINSLIIDPLITISTALLYLDSKGNR